MHPIRPVFIILKNQQHVNQNLALGMRSSILIDLLLRKFYERMKEFIFLFRGGKTTDATDAELLTHENAWDDWMIALEQRDVLIDGMPMKDDAVIVDGDSEKRGEETGDYSVTGYLILEAKDLDAAVALTKGCPIFEFGGSIEVRPLDTDIED